MATKTPSVICDLLQESTALANRIKAGTANIIDHDRLHLLSERFSQVNKHAESLFCQKLQVKILYEKYKASTCPFSRLVILEQAHDLAVDIVIIGETKKVIAASFYKVLLCTKNELASLRRSLGFIKDAVALEKCAARVYQKARRLFPTYTKFPAPILQLQTT